jgi:hypothetical protein
VKVTVHVVLEALHDGVGAVACARTCGTTITPRIIENMLASIIGLNQRFIFLECMQIKIKLQQISCWSFTQAN